MKLLLALLLLSCTPLAATEQVLVLKDGTTRPFVSCEMTDDGRYKITFNPNGTVAASPRFAVLARSRSPCIDAQTASLVSPMR